jgi:hypothetical protein
MVPIEQVCLGIDVVNVEQSAAQREMRWSGDAPCWADRAPRSTPGLKEPTAKHEHKHKTAWFYARKDPSHPHQLHSNTII